MAEPEPLFRSGSAMFVGFRCKSIPAVPIPDSTIRRTQLDGSPAYEAAAAFAERLAAD
ncbi:hypothetical protein [Streptomyces luteireticuli]|uniref:hypothetical protein n=1 Tax=Streptomyces luteireticuli TaxID=173858 RepID=UPI0031D87D65